MVVDAAGQTVFVGLYGLHKGYAWLPIEPLQDAFSLFAARATALRYADPSLPSTSASQLWAMNDAGEGKAEPGGSRVAWFQVLLADRLRGHPLPVVPLLCCAGHAARRLGELHLTGVELLLPLAFGGDSALHCAATIGEFNHANPEDAVEAEITFVTQSDDPLEIAAQKAMAQFSEMDLGPFSMLRHSATQLAAPLEPSVVPDWWWGLKDSRCQVVYMVRLPEWSLDAIGWMVTLLAGASSEAGVRLARVSVARL